MAAVLSWHVKTLMLWCRNEIKTRCFSVEFKSALNCHILPHSVFIPALKEYWRWEIMSLIRRSDVNQTMHKNEGNHKHLLPFSYEIHTKMSISMSLIFWLLVPRKNKSPAQDDVISWYHAKVSKARDWYFNIPLTLQCVRHLRCTAYQINLWVPDFARAYNNMSYWILERLRVSKRFMLHKDLRTALILQPSSTGYANLVIMFARAVLMLNSKSDNIITNVTFIA